MPYVLQDSIVGKLQLGWQFEDKLSYIHLPGCHDHDDTLVDDLPINLKSLLADIQKYLASGSSSHFKLDLLDLSRASDFRKRVYQSVFDIPRGEVKSYGEIAAAVGSPGAARAVGTTMATNPFPLVIPCHRVVSGRNLGGFGGGIAMKKQLLNLEMCNYTNLL